MELTRWCNRTSTGCRPSRCEWGRRCWTCRGRWWSTARRRNSICCVSDPVPASERRPCSGTLNATDPIRPCCASSPSANGSECPAFHEFIQNANSKWENGCFHNQSGIGFRPEGSRDIYLERRVADGFELFTAQRNVADLGWQLAPQLPLQRRRLELQPNWWVTDKSQIYISDVYDEPHTRHNVNKAKF